MSSAERTLTMDRQRLCWKSRHCLCPASLHSHSLCYPAKGAPGTDPWLSTQPSPEDALAEKSLALVQFVVDLVSFLRTGTKKIICVKYKWAQSKQPSKMLPNLSESYKMLLSSVPFFSTPKQWGHLWRTMEFCLLLQQWVIWPSFCLFTEKFFERQVTEKELPPTILDRTVNTIRDNTPDRCLHLFPALPLNPNKKALW